MISIIDGICLLHIEQKLYQILFILLQKFCNILCSSSLMVIAESGLLGIVKLSFSFWLCAAVSWWFSLLRTFISHLCLLSRLRRISRSLVISIELFSLLYLCMLSSRASHFYKVFSILFWRFHLHSRLKRISYCSVLSLFLLFLFWSVFILVVYFILTIHFTFILIFISYIVQIRNLI